MKKKKLLVLGSTGMAGHIAYYYLKNTEKYEMLNISFRNKLTEDTIILDITDKAATTRTIKDISPDIVLNCIGVLTKGSQTNPDNAIYINAFFPHHLESIVREIKAKLIHISTDCVFSGARGNYSESDLRDADDFYGKSKGLGEVINEYDLTIRTSIVGPELKQNGEGLFHWFMNQRGEINGYVEAFWGGVTTLELAKAIDSAIENELTGLVHLTNGNKISKYELLLLFKEIWGKNDVIVKRYFGKRVDKSLMISKRFKYIVPSYRIMLEELYDWMRVNRNLYQTRYR